jgi:excisionase family DNA binding protein
VDTKALTLTVSQAAAQLGLSERRIRDLCDLGKLEVERTPLGRLISAASVQALREQRAAR